LTAFQSFYQRWTHSKRSDLKDIIAQIGSGSQQHLALVGLKFINYKRFRC